MAQTSHILRKRPLIDGRSVRDMHAQAASELAALSPVKEPTEKWLEMMESRTARILSELNQWFGLSDANRYTVDLETFEECEKAIFEKLLQVREAFVHRKGNRELFKLSKRNSR